MLCKLQIDSKVNKVFASLAAALFQSSSNPSCEASQTPSVHLSQHFPPFLSHCFELLLYLQRGKMFSKGIHRKEKFELSRFMWRNFSKDLSISGCLPFNLHLFISAARKKFFMTFNLKLFIPDVCAAPELVPCLIHCLQINRRACFIHVTHFNG